jgi:hypothetical protein
MVFIAISFSNHVFDVAVPKHWLEQVPKQFALQFWLHTLPQVPEHPVQLVPHPPVQFPPQVAVQPE